MQTETKSTFSQERISSKALHKYVFVLLGVLTLAVAT